MKPGRIIVCIVTSLAIALTWMPAGVQTQAYAQEQTSAQAQAYAQEQTDEQTQAYAQNSAGASVQDLPLAAKKIDSNVNKILFHKTGDRISFLLQDSYGNYIVGCYDLTNGSYTESEPICSYSYRSYYNEDNSTLYFAATGYSSADTDTGGSTSQYIYTPYIVTYNIDSMEKQSFTMDTFTLSSESRNLISAVGADASGRIYLATYKGVIYQYSPEGTILASGSYDSEEYVYDFYGFDKTNGNFYYRSYTDWVDWGYSHEMACIKAGNVTGSKIQLAGRNLMLLYEYTEHSGIESCRMFNGQYLAALSHFNGGKMVVLDSNQYDIKDYTSQQTSYSSSDGSMQVSLLNISNTAAIKAQMVTAASRYNDSGYDVSSKGPRCAVSEDGKTLVVKTAARELTMYNLETNKKLLQTATAYDPFVFTMVGDQCIVLERDEDTLYAEQIDWSLPSDFTANAPQAMAVGDTDQITTSAATSMQLTYTYKSGSTDICSVGARGELSAWAEGTADITVTCQETGVSKTLQVRVTGTGLSRSTLDYSFCNSQGALSTNIHLPYTDGVYGDVTRSYLALDGEDFVRVEYASGKVCIGIYDKDFKLKSSRELDPELPIFGGFFSGEDAYYLAFGKKNTSESDSAEVFRFVKYDKSWNRMGACSVKGANTYIPFEAGGLDMCERNGMLYVHTCHEMYDSGDGLHHQANCDFKINQSTMKLVDSYTGVMNFTEGYVSHSFQQKVCADESMLYRADLGDAYPRAIALTGTPLENKFSKPYYRGSIVSIPTSGGGNFTGFALGGLECSDSSYIVAGCGIKNNNEKIRNVFVSAAYKDAWKADKVWLTSNTETSTINVNTPKLVKLNDNQFLLMWETVKNSDNTYRTKMKLLGPDGAKASNTTYTTTLPLSDCQPIVDSDGYVVWYVTDHSSPAFVRLNPYQLASVQTRSGADDSIAITQSVAAMTVNLSASKYTYNGKARKPQVTISGLKSSTDFKVTYKNNVKVGKATVTVTGKGKYTGTKSKSFKILPKGTTISKLTPASRGFTVKWKKQATQATGYEIMIATNSKFTKNKETVKISKTGTTSRKITKLKARTKYYVRIRTYKTVSGTKYCSSWSKQKTVTTK